MRKKIKKHFLEYRSHLRWAVIGVLFALSLFCFEIALSCYSLYLSIEGGGVVVGITWLDTVFFVFTIICGVAGIVGIGIMLYLIVMWAKKRDIGIEDIIIQNIPSLLEEIKQKIDKIEKAIKRLTR